MGVRILNQAPQVFLTVSQYNVVSSYGVVPVLQSRPDNRVDFSLMVQIRCGYEHPEDVLEFFVISPNGKSLPLEKVEMIEICNNHTFGRYKDVDQWCHRGALMINFSAVPILEPGRYLIECKTQRGGILDCASFVAE